MTTTANAPRFSSADLLAEMAAEEKKGPGAEKPEKQKDAPPPEEVDADAKSDEDDDEETPPPKPKAKDPEPDDDEDDEDDDELDPKTRRSLLAIQKQERRAREQVTRERQALETEKREWSVKLDEAKKVLELKGKARTHVDQVLEFLGLAEEDIEPFARSVYQRSPQAREAAKKNPQARAAADKALLEREQSAEVKAMRAELDSLKAEKAQAAQAAEEREAADKYLDSVTKLASTGKYRDEETGDVIKVDSPLVRDFLERTPKKARRVMAEVAFELAKATGEVPDVAEVLEALEKRRREDLEDAGVNVAERIASLTGKKADDDKSAAGKDKKPKKPTDEERQKPKGKRAAAEAEWEELKAEVKELS